MQRSQDRTKLRAFEDGRPIRLGGRRAGSVGAGAGKAGGRIWVFLPRAMGATKGLQAGTISGCHGERWQEGSKPSHKSDHNSEVGSHDSQASPPAAHTVGAEAMAPLPEATPSPGAGSRTRASPGLQGPALELDPFCAPTKCQAQLGASPLGGSPAYHDGPLGGPWDVGLYGARAVGTQAKGWASGRLPWERAP